MAASGTACTSDNAAICASCDAGFHLDPDNSISCVANVCECPNGVAMTPCTQNAATECSSCNDGFSGSECVGDPCDASAVPTNGLDAGDCPTDGRLVAPTMHASLA